MNADTTDLQPVIKAALYERFRTVLGGLGRDWGVWDLAAGDDASFPYGVFGPTEGFGGGEAQLGGGYHGSQRFTQQLDLYDDHRISQKLVDARAVVVTGFFEPELTLPPGYKITDFNARGGPTLGDPANDRIKHAVLSFDIRVQIL